MNGHFESSLPLNDSPVRISNLSPQKYGQAALKPNLSYTPSKLQSNFIYRQVHVTKKVETEKNRIRELESLSSLQQQKIRHLNQQNVTVKAALQQQIDMYKKMLREQEEQAKRLIKNLQIEYKTEIHKILLGHQQDAKVAQCQKQQYQKRIDQYLLKIQQLENLLNHQNKNVQGLTNDLHMSYQKLRNTEDKFQTSQNNNYQTINQLSSQIDALNNRLLQQTSNFKQQLDGFNTGKIRQIEALKRLHQTELQKFQNRKDAEMGAVSMELKDIKNSFEVEMLRLQEMINSKDIINESLGIELMKQKERVVALCRNYDLQINRLVSEKDHLIMDLTELNDQKVILQRDLEQLALLFESQKSRNSYVISGLHGQIGKKNMQLAGENQRLMRTVDQYEKQLMIAGNNISTLHKTLDIDKSEEIRRLMLEIKSLKEVLIESSSEMDRCKDEFLRMELEIERLMAINYQCEQESIKLKALISEQDLQLRMRRM